MNKIRLFLLQHKEILLVFLFFLAFLFAQQDVLARAGGGGGGSGGGGGGDGMGELIIYILLALPFPWNFIVAGGLVVLLIIGKKKSNQQSVLNKLPQFNQASTDKQLDVIKKKDPSFDVNAFKEKVRHAFLQIQVAWENQDLKKTRKFISDGVYQRFNTQFKMMHKLEQKNTIDNLKIKNILIDKVESDGLFDVIHVAIHASIVDKFISKKYSSLNMGGKEEFVEYWSFIKKRGTETKDIYHSQNCPKCGGQLAEIKTEVSRCPYCGTITNSGEYDWVLSEITQADDYIAANKKFALGGSFNEKIRKIISENSDFSVQLLEDKASNAFMQIQTARVYKDPKILRRFTNEDAFEKIQKTFPVEETVFNRIYTNDVTLIHAHQEKGKNILRFSIKSSYQRVIPINDKKVKILDQQLISKTEILEMSRDITAAETENSLYSHSCPNCGGALDDTMDLTCPYCGSTVNSTSREWIVTNISQAHEYPAQNASYKAGGYSGLTAGLGQVDKEMDSRDFAFNNLLILIAADGVMDAKEKEFAEKMARKWGYNVKRIQPMFEMARNGKLVIKMPEDQKQKEKIYKMLEKAAEVDGNVCDQERSLLNHIKKEYLQAS